MRSNDASQVGLSSEVNRRLDVKTGLTVVRMDGNLRVQSSSGARPKRSYTTTMDIVAIIDEDSGLRDYLLIFRCHSGARVRPDHRIELKDLPADNGPITVNIQTRYAEFKEDAPLPRELLFEVRCKARSLDEARAISLPPVGGIAVTLSFVTNASVQAPRFHLAYDVTPNVSSREFAEALLPDEAGLLPVGRWIDADSFIGVVSAIIASPEHHRLARALSQYDAALRNWNIGSRVMAMEHLYMAAEALTKSMERKRRADLQVSEPEHAKLLQVDTTKTNWPIVFHGFVRRQYILAGIRRSMMQRDKQAMASSTGKTI